MGPVCGAFYGTQYTNARGQALPGVMRPRDNGRGRNAAVTGQCVYSAQVESRRVYGSAAVYGTAQL